MASLVARLVKNLPAVRETWVQSLGWEDPLEKERAYPLQYSGLENSMDSPWGRKELDTIEPLSLHFQSWRRQRHRTPVLLPGKSHGRRSLESCGPWGR